MQVDPTKNQILARLSPTRYADFFARLKLVPFKSGQVIYEARGDIEFSYFPVTGCLSAVTVLSNGDMIEVATIGNEGAVGLPSFATAKSSPNRVFVQVPGEGLRIESSVLTQAARDEGPLRDLLHLYQAAFLFQMSQSVACNGSHSIRERCCRWLLMTHDRVGGDEMQLTHEFLAVMLGVRRPSVSEILQTLKEQGLIDYSRGKISVLNRAGLEAASCECYRAVRDEYDRLLDGKA